MSKCPLGAILFHFSSFFQYLVSAPGDELEDVQRCGHWTAASVDATFVTEKFVRTGKYPTVAQMKHAIAQNQTTQ